MKQLLIMTFLLLSLGLSAQNGKAKTTKKTFNRTTTITETIQATPEEIWMILTDASNYTDWNSTVVSIEGSIALKNKIKLISTLDPSRTFKLKVKEFIPNHILTWGDGMGNRTYTLEAIGNATSFTMTEKIGGPIFPLFASKIPSFDESFEQFTADLKKTAESN